jgi:hypothetical protein
MDIVVLSQSDELEEKRKISDANSELDADLGNQKWEWSFLRASDFF